MKKILAIVAALAMCTVVLSACGGDTASSAPASSAAPSSKAVSSTPAPASTSTVAADATEGEEFYSLDFELINNSNADLVDIRISPTGVDDFGDNMLEEGYVLPNGNSVVIAFDVEATAGTTFDMYTLDSDGDEYEYYEIPLTEISQLDLQVLVDEDGNYTNMYEAA